MNSHLWKSIECRFACSKDTVIFEKALSSASLVPKTPSSLKKCWVPLRLFQGHRHFSWNTPLQCKDLANIAYMCDFVRFACTFAAENAPICLKISANIQNLILQIVYFMLNPTKLQREA